MHSIRNMLVFHSLTLMNLIKVIGKVHHSKSHVLTEVLQARMVVGLPYGVEA